MNVIKSNHINKYLSKVSAKKETLNSAMATSRTENIVETNTSLLNVAEMLLHGVADKEILDNWLKSIDCHEFLDHFLEAGYAMSILSRVTPQDLTAIGIKEPTKRTKILLEIRKLNLQDCVPKYKPDSLSQLLELLKLDHTNYHEQLCEQQIDTVDKLCQLTWEDFEELGITKLGHQKILQLAIERLKELGDVNESNQSICGSSVGRSNHNGSFNDDQDNRLSTSTLDTKTMCARTNNFLPEPIYDSNPSQILFMTSNTENHCLNSPIISKQSSTGEISSTGSDSLHSVYSTGSYNCGQQTSANTQQPLHQSIYSQPIYSSQLYQQPIDSDTQALPMDLSNYQSSQPIYGTKLQTSVDEQPLQPIYPACNTANKSNNNNNCADKQSIYGTQSQKQDLGSDDIDSSNATTLPYKRVREQTNSSPTKNNKTPFSAFVASLPQHHRLMLQQSSIYATLTRQPNGSRRVPPPVPVRRESLRSNSIIERNRQSHMSTESLADNLSTLSMGGACNESEVGSKNYGSLMSVGNLGGRSGAHTMKLDKDRTFNGSAYLNNLRAKYWNRKNSNVETRPTTGATFDLVDEPTNGIKICDKNLSATNYRNLIYSPTHSFASSAKQQQQQQSGNYFRRMSEFNRESKTFDLTKANESKQNFMTNRNSVPIFGHSPDNNKFSASSGLENVSSIGRPRELILDGCSRSTPLDNGSDTRSVSSFVVRESIKTPVDLCATTTMTANLNGQSNGAKDEPATSRSTSSSETLHQSASFGSNDQDPFSMVISPMAATASQLDTNKQPNSVGAQNNFTHSMQSMNQSSSSSTIISSSGSGTSDNNRPVHTSLTQLSCLDRDAMAQQLSENDPAALTSTIRECNATTGVDIEFPPPPPPLAMFEFADAVSDAPASNRVMNDSSDARLAVGS